MPGVNPAWSFPYFFVGTFIEAFNASDKPLASTFPYFFVGTFIEAMVRALNG